MLPTGQTRSHVPQEVQSALTEKSLSDPWTFFTNPGYVIILMTEENGEKPGGALFPLLMIPEIRSSSRSALERILSFFSPAGGTERGGKFAGIFTANAADSPFPHFLRKMSLIW